ncbi:MAG: hypothetical protein WKG03_21090, partial [Telluria sp.]
LETKPILRDHSHTMPHAGVACAQCGQTLATPAPSYGATRVNRTGLAVAVGLHLLIVLLYLLPSEKEQHAPPPAGAEITYIKELPGKPKQVAPPAPPPPKVKPVKERKPEQVKMERLPDTITLPDERAVKLDQPEPEPEPPKAAPPAPVEDMSARIAARQAARAQQKAQSGEESEADRGNRIARANIQSANGKTYGEDERETDVSIKLVSFNHAVIRFDGWNEKFKRPMASVVDAELGLERDIETASIRRLIVIMRSGGASDVIFNSRRLSKKVTLSLRPEDTDTLEDFLFKEYFAKYVRSGAK